MNRTLRKFAIPGAGIALATTGFAFMASNTFGSTFGTGQGTSAVTGYTIQNQHMFACAAPAAPVGAASVPGPIQNDPTATCYVSFDAVPAGVGPAASDVVVVPQDSSLSAIGNNPGLPLGFGHYSTSAASKGCVRTAISGTTTSWLCGLYGNSELGLNNTLDNLEITATS